MDQPIYYSKVEFTEVAPWRSITIILLDLKMKELSLQAFEPYSSPDDREAVFSYMIKLTDEEMKSILPYCNALDFEPFRGRQMELDDAGFIGYRDEIRLKFRAFTDSHLPMIELPMYFYYDEAHIWPSEKLYRFLFENYFEGNQELKKWISPYGSYSLYFR